MEKLEYKPVPQLADGSLDEAALLLSYEPNEVDAKRAELMRNIEGIQGIGVMFLGACGILVITNTPLTVAAVAHAAYLSFDAASVTGMTPIHFP